MNEASNQGKVSQSEMMAIGSRGQNSGLSVLTYEDLYNQNVITNTEWQMLKIMDKLEGFASITEVIGTENKKLKIQFFNAIVRLVFYIMIYFGREHNERLYE